MSETDNKLRQIIEGLLLAAGKPLSLTAIAEVFLEEERPSEEELRGALALIGADCAGRGFELKEVASGFRFQVRQELSLPWLPLPHMEVRVYHDARMAEVVGAENARRFRSIYTYPNAAMHQPDEKTQLNLFLGEWLGHCLACGHELQPVL